MYLKVLRMLKKKNAGKHSVTILMGQFNETIAGKETIKSGINSRPAGEFTDNPMIHLRLIKKLGLLPLMFSNMRELKKSSVGPHTVPAKTNISTEELGKIEQKARELGAVSIGYTKVERDDIFEGFGILYPYAIVFSIEMNEEQIQKAPSYDTLKMIQKTYAQTGVVANELTNYMRKLGFGAQAGPGLGGYAVYPVLAERAGIGAFGHHGLIITPETGSRHRLAVVYTNIENLPLVKENKHKWIESFCEKCGKCIKKCPAKAIYETPVKTKGENIAYIDNKRCIQYFAKNYGCTVCVKECPFNKTNYNVIKKGFLPER